MEQKINLTGQRISIRRYQFPLLYGSVITLDNSISQEWSTVGLDLRRQFHAHGQCNVCCSRTTIGRNLTFFTHDYVERGGQIVGRMKNIVSKGILEADSKMPRVKL